MRRAAIYARFSTDLQNERSTEDQIDLCRTYADREGLEVVKTYADKARSGASLIGRDGLLTLLTAAERGEFQVVIVEALDRLSRDMEDLAGLYKRMTHWGVEIRAVHEGVANTLMVGLRGLIGQMFREDNVHKVRRGMTGLVKQGLSAGGIAYGYRPDPAKKGTLLIKDDEATIVRRIFDSYVAGMSPRAICYQLNDENVRPPRGRNWNASALNGSLDRGYGILHNQLYVGRIVWNKVRMIKDPDSGKRLSRANPKSEWQSTDVPELRIIPQDLWDAAHEKERSPHAETTKDHRRPKRLLSGLLKCGACGSGLSTNGKDKSGKVRVRCTSAAENGTCPDPKTFYLEPIERTVISAMKEELTHPKLIIEYIEAYVAERKRLAHERIVNRSNLQRKWDALNREGERLLDMLQKLDDPGPDAIPRMNAVAREKKALQAELDAVPQEEQVVVLHPAALKRYQDQLKQLYRDLNHGDDADGVAAISYLRDLVSAVTVYRDESRKGGIRVKITGKLNALLGAPAPENGVWGAMVAGEGLEPPTRGL